MVGGFIIFLFYFLWNNPIERNLHRKIDIILEKIPFFSGNLYWCNRLHIRGTTRNSKSFLGNAYTEAAVQRCSVKKVFFKISQNSQENTCARVPFFDKKLLIKELY